VHYEEYWGLKQAPFNNVPDPKFYFPSSKHEEGLHRLLYSVEGQKGAAMLTGEIGCGKTLLSRALVQHLTSDRYDLALMSNPSLGVDDFMKEILYQFGITPNGNKLDNVHALNDRLLENLRTGKSTVLIVDEAQVITDVNVFEEMRLLLNFQLDDRFLLTVVLLGQPELKVKVEAIEQLAQRVEIRYHLTPFDVDEARAYVDFRMQAAGGSGAVFTKDAIVAIHKATGGVPRKVNTLCDLALLIGFMEQCKQIDRKIVDKACMETR